MNDPHIRELLQRLLTRLEHIDGMVVSLSGTPGNIGLRGDIRSCLVELRNMQTVVRELTKIVEEKRKVEN